MRPAFLIGLVLLAACNFQVPERSEGLDTTADVRGGDTLLRIDSAAAFSDSARANGTQVRDTAVVPMAGSINTRGVAPATLVAFAKTLIGTPYVYGSTDPRVGFDCSGFITYVFNHFNIQVPRSSIDFTAVGATVDTAQARPGDLILFTGTSPEERNVGHMGIVVQRDAAGLQFIHSTSGKKMSVTITPLNEYYVKRFVRVARVFP